MADVYDPTASSSVPPPAPAPQSSADDLAENWWKGTPAHDAMVPVPEAPAQVRQEGPLPDAPAPNGGRGNFDIAGNTKANAANIWDTAKLEAKQDWMGPAIIRIAGNANYTYDPNYQMPKEGTPEFKALTKDLPEDQWAALGGAFDAKHATDIADNMRASNAAEQKLAGMGAWGIAGRFALDFTDPLAVAMGVGTSGMGTAGRAIRLARAARALEVAGDAAGSRAAIDSAKTVADSMSLGKFMAKQSAVNGAIGATLSEATVLGDPTRSQWDVAHAALGGVLMGAAFSGVFSKMGSVLGHSELDNIRTSIKEHQSRLDFAELNTVIEAKKADIVNRVATGEHVASLKGAQDDLAALQAKVADMATAREADLRSRAAPGPNDKAMHSAQTAVGDAQKGRDAAEASLPDIRARLLKEDTEIHGDQATSKPLAKLREKVAQRDHAAAKQSAQDVLDRATEEHGRLTDAQSARSQLNDVLASRKAEPDDHLGTLSPEDQADYAKKLEAANKAVDDAKATSKKVEDKATADLENLQSAQTHGPEGMLAQTPEEAVQTAAIFGEDSGGAARYKGMYDSVVEDHDTSPGDPVAKMALAKFAKVAGTFTSRFRGSDVAEVRNNAGLLVGNSVSNADRSVNQFGASEHARMLSRRYVMKFNHAVKEAYNAWADAHSHNFAAKWTRPVRDDFMTQVGLHIRGQLSEDVHVKGSAEKLVKLFAQIAKDAEEAGVKGFENLADNPHYLPRVFDFQALHDIETKIGTDNVKELVAKGIQKAHPEYDDALATKVAGFYVDRMKALRVGMDDQLLGMRFDDIGFLREFLEDSGVGSKEIADITDKFAELKKSQHRVEEGDFRNAKRRTQFDENFEMKFRNEAKFKATGEEEMIPVKISDLLNSNVEDLFSRYERTMSGHIGLAKVGIKSRADWQLRRKNVIGALEHDPNQLKTMLRDMDMVYKLITGNPVEDSGALTKWGRLIRDWNYSTTMNQAGFSQTPDWAALLSKGYIGFTLTHLPEVMNTVRRVRKGAMKGELIDDEARMMEEFLGVGGDNYTNRVFSSYDDPLAGGIQGALGKVEHGLRVAGHVTTHISGMGFMNDVGTRMAAKAVLWRLAKEVRQGNAISSARLAQIGLDQGMLKRIKAEMDRTTDVVDADFVGKSKVLNFAKWKDIEARDALLMGIFREARRMIQDEDLGDTSPWMHKTLGKMIMQFRRFMFVSYSKQLLHGIAMHDAEAATTFMVGTALASLSYTVQFGIKAAAMPAGKDKDDFIANYMSPTAIALAGWSRGNFSSFLPEAADSVTSFLGLGEHFDNRGSGMHRSFFSGIPAVSKLSALYRLGSDLAQMGTEGHQFTQSDASAVKQLVPFGNFIGADIPYHALTDGLPKSKKPVDPWNQ